MGKRRRVITNSQFPNSYIVVRSASLCISLLVKHMSAGQNKLYGVLAIVIILAVSVGAYLVMVPPVPNLDPTPEVKLTGADGSSIKYTSAS